MQAIVFYLVYPLLYLIASLPFPALYTLSDVLYYLFLLSGYRKDVVLENLKNSFPEKTPDEIETLCKSYFRYLCDLTLETLKTMRMTEEEARERFLFTKPEWLDKMYKDKKSIIIVMGHYGNWEWAGPSFSLNTDYQLVVVYRPLSNPYFEKMLAKARTKYGNRLNAVNQNLRDIFANRKSITATAFIADQAAVSANSYWTDFLNQDTSVFNGPEKIAIKFNYPVVYMAIRRVRRGYYQMVAVLLFENPDSSDRGVILEAFTRRLERDILRDPVVWLWSHRRWKHKRAQIEVRE